MWRNQEWLVTSHLQRPRHSLGSQGSHLAKRRERSQVAVRSWAVRYWWRSHALRLMLLWRHCAWMSVCLLGLCQWRWRRYSPWCTSIDPPSPSKEILFPVTSTSNILCVMRNADQLNFFLLQLNCWLSRKPLRTSVKLSSSHTVTWRQPTTSKQSKINDRISIIAIFHDVPTLFGRAQRSQGIRLPSIHQGSRRWQPRSSVPSPSVAKARRWQL